jgi:hypothetical protein
MSETSTTSSASIDAAPLMTAQCILVTLKRNLKHERSSAKYLKQFSVAAVVLVPPTVTCVVSGTLGSIGGVNDLWYFFLLSLYAIALNSSVKLT